MDGAKRDIQRPFDLEDQKALLQWKRKAHKVKNNILCDEQGRVLFLSATYQGSVHDKTIVDTEGWQFPMGMVLPSGFRL